MIAKADNGLFFSALWKQRSGLPYLLAMRNMNPLSRASGFSLLELALTMGVVGTVLTGLWQLMGVSGQVRDASSLASQAQSVAAAGQQYINSQRTSLLALGGLSALNNVVRIKILPADTGATTTSVVGLGFLDADFVNTNSYGQSYQLYVRREDAGTLGVADGGDSLVGLLISTGGSAIPDTLGARLSGFLGAAGGFIYAENNPASPTAATAARGSSGGWAVDLTAAGWSGIGANATAGGMAILTNLVPQNASGAGNGSAASPSASAIDDLSDGATNYSTLYNVYLGQNAGSFNTTGSQNTAVGYSAGRNFTSGSSNTAFGYQALRGYSDVPITGSNNTALGYNAARVTTTGSRNTAIGTLALENIDAGNDSTGIGYMAGYSCGSSDLTAIGAAAGTMGSGGTCVGSTYVGSYVGSFTSGSYNTLVGADIGRWAGQTGSYNTALGYRIYHAISSAAQHNVALGYMAAASLTSGTYNIVIGNAADVPVATGNYQLNIGNYVYGNSSTQQINLGSSTLVSGISFDLGSKTTAARLAKGTTAQRPFCNAALEGAQRWNTTTKSVEYCSASDFDSNGENDWIQLHIYGAGAGDPNTAGIGYIVLTNDRWDGNLGGMAGANAKCLSDLSTYDWKGKTTAVSNGKLVAGNVKAILWSAGWACDDWNISVVPGASYAFAVSNRPLAGGAVSTADASGNYPVNKLDWTAANYLDGQTGYWARSLSCSSTTACSTWTSNSAAQVGGVGTPGTSVVYGALRIYYSGSWDSRTGGYEDSCDTAYHLLCMVGP